MHEQFRRPEIFKIAHLHSVLMQAMVFYCFDWTCRKLTPSKVYKV